MIVGSTAIQWLFTTLFFLSLNPLHLKAHTRDEPDPYSTLCVENILIKPDPAVTLQTDPYEFHASGDIVTVSWSGVSSPSEEDFLAFFAPPESLTTSLITETAPVTFQFAHVSPSHLKSGKGELDFNILNIRDDYIVGFFKGGFHQPILVGVSNILVAANKNEVTGVHLALGKDATSMVLSWVTLDSQDPVVLLQEADTGVYSFQSDREIQPIPAKMSTFKREDLCDAPARTIGFHDPGSLHTAVLSNLTPGRSYIYQVGDQALDTWSQVLSFNTPPEKGSSDTIRFSLIADLGTARPDGSHHGEKEEYDAIKSVALIKERLANHKTGLDFVMHVGDISYADGYLARWDEFLKLIEPVASKIPWMTAVGNHERCSLGTSKLVLNPGFWEETSSGGECNVPYRKYFPMPYPKPRIEEDSPWYSFDFGPVHFTVISSEHDFTFNSKQYRWIVSDLQRVDRDSMPWLIFACHRPMYVNSAAHGDGNSDEDQDVSKLLQKFIEPLLLKFKVDIAIYGHHHSYQRTCQLANGKCVASSQNAKAQAPVHLIVGMAGRALSDNLLSSLPEWSERLDNEEHGVTFVEANQTHFRLEMYADTSLTTDYKRDEILLYK